MISAPGYRIEKEPGKDHNNDDGVKDGGQRPQDRSQRGDMTGAAIG